MKNKYVITDPCYLVDDDTWDTLIKDWDNFTVNLAEHLTKKTGEKAYAASTGFGDWTNALYGDNYEKPFGADAGLVCVCRYTEQIDEELGLIYPGCYAVFEAEGPLNVMFNFDDPSWTEVYIEDAAGNEWSTLPSERVDDSEFYTEDL